MDIKDIESADKAHAPFCRPRLMKGSPVLMSPPQ